MNLPPHNHSAEQALLGSLICAGALGDHGMEIIAQVRELIPTPDCFFTPYHGTVFAVIGKVVDDSGSLDDIQLIAGLKAAGAFDMNKLEEAVESVGVAVNAPAYAKEIVGHYRKRLVAGAITAMQAAVDDPTVDANECLAIAQAKLGGAELTNKGDSGDMESSIADEVFAMRMRTGASRGVRTGFSSLDFFMNGLEPGLHILAARPSVGKSALALNITDYAAKNGDASAVFSMEMTRRELAIRTMSQHLSMDSNQIKGMKPQEVSERRDDLQHCIEAYKDVPLYIESVADLSMGVLKMKVRRYVQQQGVKLIAIDYLGLMRMPKQESRNLALGELSRGLKVLSMELEIPILCLHQLNRPVKGQETRRPTMVDLRESGHIEQDADSVLLLHRTSAIDCEGPAQVELLVEKQRSGRRGVIELGFEGSTTRFFEKQPEGV